MRKKLFLSALFSLLMIAANAKADNIAPVQQTIQVGLEGAGIGYREPSLSVKETGPGGGVYGIYEYRSPNLGSNVLHLDGHVDYFNVDYNGSGKINNISDVTGEPRVWIGHDFIFNQEELTPYLGLGYRFLFDHLNGKTSSTGAAGYDRLSQYLYAPIGFEVSTDAVSGWRFGFNAEYDIFIHGWQKSYLSTFSGFPDITNNQSHGYGIRGSIDIVKKGTNVDFVVSPYIRYWNVRQSSTATATGTLFQISGYEPSNHSTEIGCKFGVEF